ncbi:ABC transporter permease subunit/CPBP intramembrane protease [Adhaeretor mobilis]|uniref:ABC-2 family transporter protein n=1 Tax=Adhaeretor mobilis TaxID=1930276 RepID=A0A517MXA8_9BACT|nr:ABC transporter permease subunit/CPBP intramembrane protease [Adhaeretor mobilis]QDS99514.1 ABC-2 family transporter protein [Adhaeretor mobilis]
MQWKNVKLIFLREMRDQLRDRRTLFLIAILPLLLYPLLGMSFMQMMQFMQSNTAKILIVNAQELESPELQDAEWLPPLLEGDFFSPELIPGKTQRDSLQVVRAESLDPEDPADIPLLKIEGETPEQHASRLLKAGHVQAVLEFPAGFGKGLLQVRETVIDRQPAGQTNALELSPTYNAANEKSQSAQIRLERVLRLWRQKITAHNLTDSHVPIQATQPFDFQPVDTAPVEQKQVVVLSKILPFVLIIWALTGAFYPAVDLCAGEKERGTLETLLTSPAMRREIVWGKLLTVMLFSSATALLNLATLGLTSKFVTSQLAANPAFGSLGSLTMPSASAMALLVLSLVPISALFGALCLACAAFARSTKEGQYYLMPLMLVTMPLMLLPMSPGVELDLGTSLVPLTGLILLLRSAIEGQYLQALPFVVPVLGVTSMCCLLAIRWAEEQFASESVLFRESERLELGRWLKSLVRDRCPTPTLPQGVLCIALIMIVQFFVSVAFTARSAEETSYSFIVISTLVMQLGCVLAPAALMTIFLTSKPAKSLLLDRWPQWKHLGVAGVLALLVHPLSVRLSSAIQEVYPISPEMQGSLQQFQEVLFGSPYWWATLLLIAVLPAVCEEIAFRGFILSGLRHLGHKWWAICITAVAFGAVHPVMQQKLSAASLGLLIGYLAVQTGSLLPCTLFHAFHNGLQVGVYRAAEYAEANPNSFAYQLLGGKDPALYQPAVLLLCGIAATLLILSLQKASYDRTKEEKLQEARDRGNTPLVSV